MLSEPTWGYSRQKKRFLVTLKASVILESGDGTLWTRAATASPGEKLLQSLRMQVKEVGFDILHEQTRTGHVLQALKAALADRFKKTTEEWWQSLSGAELVTKTERGHMSSRHHGTRIVSWLDIPLSDRVTPLDEPLESSRKVLRIKVTDLKEHEYHFPAPLLTYVRPSQNGFLGLPFPLTSSTGGEMIMFEGSIAGLNEHSRERLDRIVTRSIHSMPSRVTELERHYGPLTRSAREGIGPGDELTARGARGGARFRSVPAPQYTRRGSRRG
jgi:hypothetical protein